MNREGAEFEMNQQRMLMIPHSSGTWPEQQVKEHLTSQYRTDESSSAARHAGEPNADRCGHSEGEENCYWFRHMAGGGVVSHSGGEYGGETDDETPGDPSQTAKI
ncbi:hypothetical protein BCL67_1256 [Nesterenkonia sandarakina]|uniref:Uncharacterized protein n=1 Tax=Nesterenkonia sandarakina TaxID=272918 RepID=A0A2T0YBU9_9MICC|nr:hypothetical protein BCL67_1256 [Nesterenkonia sandarakina]